MSELHIKVHGDLLNMSGGDFALGMKTKHHCQKKDIQPSLIGKCSIILLFTPDHETAALSILSKIW